MKVCMPPGAWAAPAETHTEGIHRSVPIAITLVPPSSARELPPGIILTSVHASRRLGCSCRDTHREVTDQKGKGSFL